MSDYKDNFEINKYYKDTLYNSFYLDYFVSYNNVENVQIQNENLNFKIKTFQPDYNNEDNVFSSLR